MTAIRWLILPILLSAVLLCAGCMSKTNFQSASYTPVLPEELGGPVIPQKIPASWKKLPAEYAKASYAKILEEYKTDELDHPLQVLNMPFPEYPQAEQRRGVWGDVEISILINEAGLIEEATVLKAPSETLAQVSLAAIRLWRFAPITRNGKPLKLRCLQSFPFRLP